MKDIIRITFSKDGEILYTSPEEGEDYEFEEDNPDARAKGLVNLINNKGFSFVKAELIPNTLKLDTVD